MFFSRNWKFSLQLTICSHFYFYSFYFADYYALQSNSAPLSTGASHLALVVKNLPISLGDAKGCGFVPMSRKIPWRRAWQPIPAFLPGEYHGQRILVGYSPWGHKESDTIKVTTSQLCSYYHFITWQRWTFLLFYSLVFSFSVIFVTLNTVNSKDHALKLPSGWLKTSHIEYWTCFCFLSFYYLFIY